MKDSFVFRKKWKDAIEGLPDEIRLEIYDSIIEYATSGRLSDLKQMAMIAFNFIKQDIDKDLEKYEAKCKKNRENAKMRWDANNANASERIKRNANDADNDNEYDNDNDNINDIKEKPATPPSSKKSKQELLKERETKFKADVFAFADYPKDMLDKFFLYWSEPNKSRTKMLWETKPTFEISRRLSTWAGKNFDKRQPEKFRNDSVDVYTNEL